MLMPESIDGLIEIAFEVNDLANSKGFWDDFLYCEQHPVQTAEIAKRALVTEKLALIMTEVSEAIEQWRADPEGKDEHCPDYLNVEVELADAIIRILDLAVQMGWDIPGALFDKHEYNARRDYKHGKRF